ncbi:MAG: caspase family protein, partial [Bacteroidota bacterium]
MGDPRPQRPLGPRPLDSHDFRRYFVLLVGINKYNPPVSKLGGCVADVENIESFLLNDWLPGRADKDQETDCDDPGIDGVEVESHGPLHILKLMDEHATYNNIEKAFNLFLRQAHRTEENGKVVEDVAWFHFSGHGTEDFAAEEFKVLEPNGKDQAIVCYKEKKEDGYLLMKDKEIAVLLNHVATVDPMGDAKKFGAPHIMVSLDCCHSGSGTRDFVMDENIKTRFATITDPQTRTSMAKEDTSRGIGDYANGYYKNQTKLSVPITPHVALSGCESVQLAGDLPGGGVFSSGLIDALKATNGNLDYSDLYTRSRSFVQKRRGKEQTPQFDVVGEFNPYIKFMDGEPSKDPIKYGVDFVNDGWRVKCGAVHGLPMSSDKKIKITVQDLEGKTLGTAELGAVSAQHSSFTWSGDISLDTTKPESYRAVINFLPIPPALVYVHGDEDGVDALENDWDDSKSIQMVRSLDGVGEAQIEVEVTGDQYLLKDRKHNVMDLTDIAERPRSMRDIEDLVMNDLGKMANWDRFLQLNNKNSKIANWIEFEIDYSGSNPDNVTTLKESSVIKAVEGADLFSKKAPMISSFE